MGSRVVFVSRFARLYFGLCPDSFTFSIVGVRYWDYVTMLSFGGVRL
ncbi:hypothetical protein M6B38_231600 [Iris pallida]|uniref:Uncharacterized protein n=1 Tax=Iris pallida TaxID=29817 RepID=A0AAX6DR28_IRIPA|nr:hypothetical protein M6B38_231600 [Iris pallida]